MPFQRPFSIAVFDNRELALLIWLGALVVWAIAKHRPALLELLRSFKDPELSITFAVTFVYGVGVVWLLAWLGLWTNDLISETLFWLFGPGVVLLVGIATRTATEDAFFRRTLRRLLAFTVALEFVINLYVLPLPIEIALVPLLVTLVAASVVAEGEARHRQAATGVGCLLLLIGGALLAFSIVNAVNDPDFASMENLREFLLPILMTLAFVPYLFTVGVYASYDSAFVCINDETKSRRQRLRAKCALISKVGFRTRDVRAFGTPWGRTLSEARSFRTGRRVVDDFQKWARERRMEPIRERERLEQFAGVSGTDDEGRQLDQREFKETKEALRVLSGSQMGWFRNQGKRYRPELLDMVLSAWNTFGLPEAHGIEMYVAKNGKHWWAWRRTVSGWCLGIGASAAPPDEWIYDAADPPTGPPDEGRAGWSRFGVAARNW